MEGVRTSMVGISTTKRALLSHESLQNYYLDS